MDTISLKSDPRVQAIMDAAIVAFSQYGYRRTSMEDIAKGAGMSRAALYLHYRNKEDIFRSLTVLYLAQGAEALERELTPARDPSEAILAVFEAAGGPAIELMLSTTHGQELLEAKSSVAATEIAEWAALLRTKVAAWLTKEAGANRISLRETDNSAEDMALLIQRLWFGIKEQVDSFDAYKASIRQVAGLIGRGLKV
ncbi:TetR/AcrR family transcriptional regulator [Marivivens aquimaris]|uniref:TetR/AcrR family transcriptional regulator n=1 Tax=Marivivens aquimaris TaxID=2774876 RepID=UPI00188182AA|nr:TetR/AcrR family transcriptional regulator [Marivivens aquimaris]